MLPADFTDTIDTWIKALEGYDLTQLCAKPSSGSWSLGQLYLHLIADTNYYIGQIKICMATNDHMDEEASPTAKAMLLADAFPDAAIEGDPSNAAIPQPAGKEQLLDSLLAIKAEMHAIALSIAGSFYKGKTKHPGLNYFSAGEWFQFAGMHFRHHLRQKKRIDDFLKKSSY